MIHYDRLNEPFYIRKPSRIFVCSVSDFWGKGVKDMWRMEVYNINGQLIHNVNITREVSNQSISGFQEGLYFIRVIDGDTIILDDNERVRLIGVDTPETVHPQKPVEYFGKEASAFTKSMVERKNVRLEYDWERKDKYGRTLAYVYLEDGTFLNAEIVKQGYGHAYTRFPFKYLERFREYEQDAQEHQIGLWKGQ